MITRHFPTADFGPNQWGGTTPHVDQVKDNVSTPNEATNIFTTTEDEEENFTFNIVQKGMRHCWALFHLKGTKAQSPFISVLAEIYDDAVLAGSIQFNANTAQVYKSVRVKVPFAESHDQVTRARLVYKVPGSPDNPPTPI